MSSTTDSVDDKIRQLPPELQAEAIQYIDGLLERSKRKYPVSYRCSAEGTLAELGNRYSSVELQHEASGWRGA